VERIVNPGLSAVLVVVGLLLGQAALAGPSGSRMPPEERDRLRNDLRQQRPEDDPRARGWDPRSGGARGGEPVPFDRSRRPASPGAGYNGDGRGYEGQRMSPEERRQLRMLLRERSREERDRPRN
jgi:uncharacterized membrane protein